MIELHRKIVMDEQGRPCEVILPWAEYEVIAEMLGLDLDEAARRDLAEAKRDRQAGKRGAFVSLDEL